MAIKVHLHLWEQDVPDNHWDDHEPIEVDMTDETGDVYDDYIQITAPVQDIDGKEYHFEGRLFLESIPDMVQAILDFQKREQEAGKEFNRNDFTTPGADEAIARLREILGA